MENSKEREVEANREVWSIALLIELQSTLVSEVDELDLDLMTSMVESVAQTLGMRKRVWVQGKESKGKEKVIVLDKVLKEMERGYLEQPLKKREIPKTKQCALLIKVPKKHFWGNWEQRFREWKRKR